MLLIPHTWVSQFYLLVSQPFFLIADFWPIFFWMWSYSPQFLDAFPNTVPFPIVWYFTTPVYFCFYNTSPYYLYCSNTSLDIFLILYLRPCEGVQVSLTNFPTKNVTHKLYCSNTSLDTFCSLITPMLSSSFSNTTFNWFDY